MPDEKLLSDEELALMHEQLEAHAKALTPAVAIAAIELRAMLAEIRAHRAAQLNDEEIEALRFLREWGRIVMAEEPRPSTDPEFEIATAALAALDKLLRGGAR